MGDTDTRSELERRREEFRRRPDLYVVEDFLRGHAATAFDECNVRKLLISVDTRVAVALVLDNIYQLGQRGMLEEAVVRAYVNPKVNSLQHPLYRLEHMLQSCDRQKLRSFGQPLPGTGPFRVYRGVAGRRRNRRVRGLSCTSSLDIACWFARYAGILGEDDPAVYWATLRDEDIYFYTNGRNEQEVVARPKYCRRLKLTTDEIYERAERYRSKNV